MIIDSTRSFSYQKIAAGLARSLAHEVKNPLSGIKGSAQILKKKYSDDFSKKFLKIIVDETDRLNEIVTKILTPAKKPDLNNFNLHEALERVLNLIGVDELKNIELIKSYDPSIPDLYGDKNLFIQAVLNIVQNAIQAMTIKLDNPILKISTAYHLGNRLMAKFTQRLHKSVSKITVLASMNQSEIKFSFQWFLQKIQVQDWGYRFLKTS